MFDTVNRHKFRDIGAQMWATPDFTAERDAIIRDLHMTWARIELGPRLTADDLAEHMSVDDVLVLVECNRERELDQIILQRYQALHDELRRTGVRVHAIVWSPPERWMEYTTFQGAAIKQINPVHLADYANVIAANLIYARRNGLETEAVEFVNDRTPMPPCFPQKFATERWCWCARHSTAPASPPSASRDRAPAKLTRPRATWKSY